jgi:hypothetical protein
MAQLNSDDLNLGSQQPKRDPASAQLDPGKEAGTEVSHAPLNLGGGDSAPAAPPRPAPAAPRPAAPAAKPAAAVAPRPIPPKPAAAGAAQPAVAAGARITKVKLFFTKLHAGALDFLTEQIEGWLAANPDVVIKRTNMVVGEVAAKKTEANLIISVWY